jgi:hypothetical protein
LIPQLDDDEEDEHVADDASMDSGEDSDCSYKEIDDGLRLGGSLNANGISKAFCKGHWSKEEVYNQSIF